MEFAENLALDHPYEKDLGEYLKKAPRLGGFHYFNAKKINVLNDNSEDGELDKWDKWVLLQFFSAGVTYENFLAFFFV